jgi:hypothetical protein
MNFKVEDTVTLFRLRIKVFYMCCYISVDFATAALQNSMHHPTYISYNHLVSRPCSMIKYESNEKI